jgi:RND family efflux transporter MFP subunit
VKNGEKVRKGQVLARLDQKDISLSYDKAKASERSAKSQLDHSKSNLDRIKELYQSNSASLADYEKAKNNYSSAQANYDNAVKSMNIQSSQFEYAIIKAPMDGIITQVNADVNEVAQAGNPILIMNSEGDDLEITVGVPESYISKVQEGKPVEVNINNTSVEGLISEVAFSTGGSLTYSVVVKLIDPSPDLRPGMPAEVTFAFDGPKTSSEQILVPVKGVGNDADGDFVFVLKKNKKETYQVQKVRVELGELKTRGFVVNNGLNKGDLVAVAGLRTLYDGMNVKLLN